VVVALSRLERLGPRVHSLIVAAAVHVFYARRRRCLRLRHGMMMMIDLACTRVHRSELTWHGIHFLSTTRDF